MDAGVWMECVPTRSGMLQADKVYVRCHTTKLKNSGKQRVMTIYFGAEVAIKLDFHAGDKITVYRAPQLRKMMVSKSSGTGRYTLQGPKGSGTLNFAMKMADDMHVPLTNTVSVPFDIQMDKSIILSLSGITSGLVK